MKSRTYEIYSRTEDQCWLADTETYTLALSDTADSDTAENIDETTSEMLADCFDFPALLGLALQIGNIDHHEKLVKAIRIAASMPDGMARS